MQRFLGLVEAEAPSGLRWHVQAMAQVDELYRLSGEAFDLERPTPYPQFESLLSHLIANNRLDEAAAFTLQNLDRYSLTFLSNAIAGIAGLYADSGREQAAATFLTEVLEFAPEDETARRLLAGLQPD